MRLIDADNLREEWLLNGLNENVYCTNDFLASIDVQDTIDAAPVVHAKWQEEIIKKEMYGKIREFWQPNSCSVCHCAGPKIETNYCPNCGAKMDLEEE